MWVTRLYLSVGEIKGKPSPSPEILSAKIIVKENIATAKLIPKALGIKLFLSSNKKQINTNGIRAIISKRNAALAAFWILAIKASSGITQKYRR